MVFHKIVKEYGDLIPVIKETKLDLVHRMEVAGHNETHIQAFIQRIKKDINEFIKSNNSRRKYMEKMIDELKKMESDIASDKVVNALEEETKLGEYIKQLWLVEDAADKAIDKVAHQILVLKLIDAKTEEEIKLTSLEAEDLAKMVELKLKDTFR